MQVLSDTKDLLRSAVAQIFGFAGRLVARAGFILIAADQYGDASLGVLGIIAAISEIAVALGVLGLKRSLLDQLSELAETGRNIGARVTEAIIISTMFGVIISCALLFIWPHILPSKPLIWACLFFMIPCNVFSEIALTAIKYKRVVRWDVWARSIAESWVLFILAALFLALGWKDIGLPLAYAISLFFVTAIAGTGLIKNYSRQELRTQWKGWAHILEIPKRSYKVGITDIGTMALRRIDLIVMSVFVSPSVAGLYFMIQQIATLSQRIPALFEPMLSPILARLHNQRKVDGIRSNLTSICRWVFIITLSLSMPLIIFGDQVLSLFNPVFIVGGGVLAVILVAELIEGTFISVETPLIFKHPKIPPTLIISTLIIEIVLIVILTQYWGIMGTAMGFLISMIYLSVLRLFFLKSKIDVNVISKDYILPVIIAILLTAGLLAIRSTVIALPRWVLGLVIIGSVILYIGMIRLFALSHSDKFFLRILSRNKNKAQRTKVGTLKNKDT